MKQQNSKIPAKRKQEKSAFRLLPLMIFFCVLMLSVRIGGLWRAFSASRGDAPSVLSVAALQAQSPEPSKDDIPLSKVAQHAAMQVANELPAQDKSFSQSELEILQKLAKRREELDIRERTLEQKVGVLKAAEAQIDAKIVKLKELERTISDLVGVYNEQERDRMNNLVKIYSTMKPKEAARLFNDMEMSLLVRVFEKMKESKSAPILALMDSAKATALTAELANKKTLPMPDSAQAEK
mgnify:CR=1 FL=1